MLLPSWWTHDTHIYSEYWQKRQGIKGLEWSYVSFSDKHGFLLVGSLVLIFLFVCLFGFVESSQIWVTWETIVQKAVTWKLGDKSSWTRGLYSSLVSLTLLAHYVWSLQLAVALIHTFWSLYKWKASFCCCCLFVWVLFWERGLPYVPWVAWN